MTRQMWLTAAAGLAILITSVWYVRREERVRGRGAAAVLRALALFLVLGGLFLPTLGSGDTTKSGLVVLFDTSRSMNLPASPTATRLDSARAVIRSLAPDMIIAFGDAVAQLPFDSLAGVGANAGATRVGTALETARRLGADSVVVITDGEWDDRRVAIEAAERLGLGLREVRVLDPPSRIGIRSLSGPHQVRSGDSTRFVAEVFASGPSLPDSVEVELRQGERTLITTRVAVPGSGRGVRVTLPFRPRPPAGDSEWRRYDVVLDGAADPYGAASTRSSWTEVTKRATGVVLVALAPDWEPRYLLPALRRSSSAGATGYIQTAPGRFVGIGTDPYPVSPGDVLADARSADLLVLVGPVTRIPDELRAVAERQDRLLVLPGAEGAASGTPIRLRAGRAGDWYLDETIEASPISGLLAGMVVEDVPPLSLMLEAEGPVSWLPLSARRDRQGPSLPVLVGGTRSGRRWVVATGKGYWRWAFRQGAPRQLYERAFTGVAGWLLENRVLRLVQLVSDPVGTGRPLEVQVASGVENLTLAIVDSAGLVWSDSVSPGPTIRGPILEPGTYRLQASGSRGGSPFRFERPFLVVDASRELEPRDIAPAASIAAAGPATRVGASRKRPVWPFVVAALLLCAEWAWRRRIGLR